MTEAGAKLILAADLGGTRLRVAAVTADGRIVDRASTSTLAAGGPTQVIGQFEGLAEWVVDRLGGWAHILGISVSVAGVVEATSGTVVTAPNLAGWDRIPLRQLLEADLHRTVVVGNDANLAALGEHRYGVGRGTQHMVYLTVSTGIGGGLILNGELYLGATGLAAEVGHMALAEDGRVCGCGKAGCLEAVASGTAIAQRAREKLQQPGTSSQLQVLMDRGAAGLTAAEVARAARDGDRVAIEVLDEAGVALGRGIVNLLHLLEPERVVLGGGVTGAGDLLFEPMRRAIQEHALPGFGGIPVVQGVLGDDAGLLGAAAWFLASANGTRKG